MSTAYREMRRSKLPLQRARSRAQFQTMCDALSELKGIFWSASATSEMGKKLLKEMDRVFTVVSSSESRRERHSENTNTPANGLANQDTRSDSAGKFSLTQWKLFLYRKSFMPCTPFPIFHSRGKFRLAKTNHKQHPTNSMFPPLANTISLCKTSIPQSSIFRRTSISSECLTLLSTSTVSTLASKEI